MERSDYLQIAIKAAKEAGEFIVERYNSLDEIGFTRKALFDYVTEIDAASEQLIIKTLRNTFPSHRILSEETLKESSSEDEYLWIIDPLDGTTNFIHKYPVFAISIALQYKDEIITGVVYDPLRDELFTAEKGRGAFLNDQRIFVSKRNSIEDAIITTGFPFRAKDRIDDYLEVFKSLFLRCSDLRRAGSAALDLAYTASGRCEGFFELGLSAWDVAAGSLLVKEAGGIVSDFKGGSEYLSTGNIVASTPAIHGIIVDEVQRVFNG
ncbi:MAG: inositol monophosphatase [Nitrospirae bacterium]|nr:inositol monophosphatase [Nitrospirota bacterium]